MTELNILHIIQNFNFVTVMSNIKNNSLNYLMSYPSTNTVLTFVGPSVGLISSICCLTILNSHLKKLHPTFKTLMNIILVHNVVSLVASIGLSTFIQSKTKAVIETSYIEYINKSNNAPILTKCLPF